MQANPLRLDQRCVHPCRLGQLMSSYQLQSWVLMAVPFAARAARWDKILRSYTRFMSA